MLKPWRWMSFSERPTPLRISWEIGTPTDEQNLSFKSTLEILESRRVMRTRIVCSKCWRKRNLTESLRGSTGQRNLWLISQFAHSQTPLRGRLQNFQRGRSGTYAHKADVLQMWPALGAQPCKFSPAQALLVLHGKVFLSLAVTQLFKICLWGSQTRPGSTQQTVEWTYEWTHYDQLHQPF